MLFVIAKQAFFFNASSQKFKKITRCQINFNLKKIKNSSNDVIDYNEEHSTPPPLQKAIM